MHENSIIEVGESNSEKENGIPNVAFLWSITTMIIRKDPIVGRKGPDGKKPKNMLFFASHQKEPICDRLCISFITSYIGVCATYVFRQKYKIQIQNAITKHKYKTQIQNTNIAAKKYELKEIHIF